jgi:hypothetical protein
MKSDARTDAAGVVMSVADGRVRIGTPFGSGPRTAVLPVYAGLVEVNPLRPHGVPHTELHFYDADERFGWLADVYGWTVARTIADMDGGDLEIVLPWEPGWLHPILARLAVARWLTVWGPAPGSRRALDHRLLDAEIGHLAMRCADVLHHAEDTAVHHLARAKSLLDRLIEPALAEQAAATAAEAAARAVRLWAGTAMDLLGADAPTIPGGPSALRARRADDMAAEDAPLPVESAKLQLVMAPRLGPFVSTVDRLQVLPNLVDESLDAVSWEFVDNGADRWVRVSVGGSPAEDIQKNAPSVRIYAPGRPLPVAVEQMRLDGPSWQAELRVPGIMTTEWVVDVFSPELGRAARLGHEAERAKLERETAKLVSDLRFAAYQEPFRLRALAGTSRNLAAEFATLAGPVDPLTHTLSVVAEEAEDGSLLADSAWRLTVAELVGLDRQMLGARYRPQS